jgi:hypothetical protein
VNLRVRTAAGAAILAALAAGCPRNTAPTDAAPPSVAQPLPASAAPPPRPPEVNDLWARAKDADAGDEDDVVRLARREGVAGLIERGAHPAWRNVAARAMGYSDGFGALAWLGEVARGADEADAFAALGSAVTLAAQARHQIEGADAEELRAGCDALLGLARDEKQNRRRRVLAVRALRMLTDKGCAKPADIPGDLDAR